MGIKFETSNINTSNLTSNISNNYEIKPISVSSSSYVNSISNKIEVEEVDLDPVVEEKSWWDSFMDNWHHGIEVIGESLGKMESFKKWDQAGGADITKIVLSTGGNVLTGVGKGIFNTVEGIADTAVNLVGIAATPFTGLIDGIGYLTGNDLGVTNRLWNDGIKQIVGCQVVDNTYNAYYSDYGKIMNDNAHDWFKTDAMGYQVSEMVGTVLTNLAFGSSLGSTGIFGEYTGLTSNAGKVSASIIAGSTGFGQGTEDAWNDGAGILSGLGYGALTGALDFSQYMIGGAINNVVVGSGKSILSKLGTIGVRALLDGFDNGVEGLIRPAYKSLYNGASWWDNFNEIGGWNNVLTQFLIGAGISAGAESIQVIGEKISTPKLKNNVDSSSLEFKNSSKLPEISDPFWTNFDNRDEVRLIVNGKSMSIDDAILLRMEYDGSLKGKVDSIIRSTKENIESKRKLNQFKKATRFTNDQDIALHFNDRNQYMYHQLEFLKSTYPNDYNIDMIYNKYYFLPNYLKSADAIYNDIFSLGQVDTSYQPMLKWFTNERLSGMPEMYKLDDYSSLFSNAMKEEGYAYSRITGPILGAYERGADCRFVVSGTDDSGIYHGSIKSLIEDEYINSRDGLAISLDFKVVDQVKQTYGDINFLQGTKNIDEAVKIMDDMIDAAQPLKKDTILYRGANSLFFDGQLVYDGKMDISQLKVGQIINDKATVSTSLMYDKCYKGNDIIMEILAPEGTKGVYLESMVRGYGQQEFLLGRNTNFRIVSEPVLIDVTYEKNGKWITEKKPKIQVEIVSDDVADKTRFKYGKSEKIKTTTTLEIPKTDELPIDYNTAKLPSDIITSDLPTTSKIPKNNVTTNKLPFGK